MKELTPEQLKQKCFDQAVKYLAISPRSEQEVKDKLYEKGYHREQVDYAIERCKGYKYINDEAYTRSFVDYYSHKMGRKMLLYKLTNEKGVDSTLATNMIADLVSDKVEIEKCQNIAQKYINKKRIAERKDMQKVSAYLYTKGFEWNVINVALSSCNLHQTDANDFDEDDI
jgi:regulatory protein